MTRNERHEANEKEVRGEGGGVENDERSGEEKIEKKRKRIRQPPTTQSYGSRPKLFWYLTQLLLRFLFRPSFVQLLLLRRRRLFHSSVWWRAYTAANFLRSALHRVKLFIYELFSAFGIQVRPDEAKGEICATTMATATAT